MNRPASFATGFSRRAFTLIELLTVIAIIGILAAIIIPTIGKVRDTAKTSQCVSNMRQIGIALALYATDNKNVLPAAGAVSNSWVPAVEPYLPKRKSGAGSLDNSVFVCPAAEKTYTAPATSIAYSYTVLGGFLVQAAPTTFDGTATGRHMATIVNPSRAAWLTDGRENSFSNGISYAYISMSQATLQDRSRGDFRHGTDRANLLFADGSVRGFSNAEVASIFPDTATWRGLR
jgi:prepilin-type N-terminal cleavage/methylation domain-containing protein/prepilin-type processing-associated H-X9-DG protein